MAEIVTKRILRQKKQWLKKARTISLVISRKKKKKKEKLKDYTGGWPKGFKEHHYANEMSEELNSYLGQ